MEAKSNDVPLLLGVENRGMDDNGSQSSDSVATSEEYEFINNCEPEPPVASQGNVDLLMTSFKDQIVDNMAEAAMDTTVPIKKEPGTLDLRAMSSSSGDSQCTLRSPEEKNLPVPSAPPASTEPLSLNLTQDPTGMPHGKDSSVYATSPSPVEESVPVLSRSPSLQLADGEFTLFNRVVYLGCAAINAPRSEPEIQRNIAILNEQSSEQAIEVALSIPNHSEGIVKLYEANTSNEMTSFPIPRILFCARGPTDSTESQCLAFTCSHGITAETAIFQCHVLRCDVPEAVVKILQCFASAFRRIPKLPGQPSAGGSTRGGSGDRSSITTVRNNEQVFTFEANVEIREEDAKGSVTSCPKDKDYFKLRCNLEKKIILTVQQVTNDRDLVIDRCFGLLVCPGRNVKHSDMQLIEMQFSTTQPVGEKILYQMIGSWNPMEAPFEVLNTETPRDTRVYMTVAVDLVISGILEPVRFVIETKAKIFPQNERFWSLGKKGLIENFYLRLREAEQDGSTNSSHDHVFDVVSLESRSQLERKKNTLSLSFKPEVNTPLQQQQQPGRKGDAQSESSPGDPDSESDNDEPLLSGTGEVSKDCTQTELEGWAAILAKWHTNLDQRPKQLGPLVRRGIPEALRGEVWQLLSSCQDSLTLFNTYRLLITKESPCETVIQRDINRTFPAHDYFRDTGGTGQDSLYKICKAYSLYDQEVGYCQGLSFLAAALLLHMPEEQAFSVLVKIMSDYGLRNLFRNGFEELHLKFYLLERLLEERLPELHSHFADLGVEAHMYGSQWFLTLFTAKFPLYVVFFILDLFLMDGMDTIFQVALALLMMSKKDLLALDFEGILKHFRVALPKKYRSEETARQLLHTAASLKLRKLRKYEKDFVLIKQQEKQKEDPVERLTRENKRLLESNMRLEQENDDLASELVNSKITLCHDLDLAEDRAESLSKDLGSTRSSLTEAEEEKKRLEVEVAQLKELCRRELRRTEADLHTNATIIADYKQICSQLSMRLEKEQTAGKKIQEEWKSKVSGCENCGPLFCTPRSGKTRASGPDGENEVEGHPLGDAGKDEEEDTERQVRELELELAQTKLALVEAECKNQDLNHQLNSALAELTASKNTWFHKTLTSIRDVTKKEYLGNPQAKDGT